MLLSYISQPQIWNKYAYTINNPLNHTDPDGRRPLTKEDRDRIAHLWHAAEATAKEDGNDKLLERVSEAIGDIIHAIHDVPESQADPANLKAVFWAIDNLGNSVYGENGTVSNGVTVTLGAGKNKCNLFVANAYAFGAGVGFDGQGVPTYSTMLGSLIGRKKPPSANDLANPSISISNFPVVKRPGVGIVVAFPPGPLDVLGHSGISAGGVDVIVCRPERWKGGNSLLCND
jgi:hypothetical protein